MREHTDFDPYLTGPAKHYRRLALGISTAIQIPPERLAQEAKPRDPIIVQFGMSNAAGLHFHRVWLPRAMLAGGIDIGWAMRGLLRDYPNQPDFQRNKRPSLRHLLYPGVGCGAGLPISVLSRESNYNTPTDRHTIYTELYLGWAPGMQAAAALPELLTPYRTFWSGAPITTSQYSIKEHGDRTDIYTPWAETLTIRYYHQFLYHTLAPQESTLFIAEKRNEYRDMHPLYREAIPFWYRRKFRPGWLQYFNRLGGRYLAARVGFPAGIRCPRGRGGAGVARARGARRAERIQLPVPAAPRRRGYGHRGYPPRPGGHRWARRLLWWQ